MTIADAIPVEAERCLFETAHVVTFEEDGERTVVTLDAKVVSAQAGAAGPLSGMAQG